MGEQFTADDFLKHCSIFSVYGLTMRTSSYVNPNVGIYPSYKIISNGGLNNPTYPVM